MKFKLKFKRSKSEVTPTQIINVTTSVEFNEPDFPEYDSTPYGGGYDICTTYGRPLPPSDKTCYPRSAPTPTPTPTHDPPSPPHVTTTTTTTTQPNDPNSDTPIDSKSPHHTPPSGYDHEPIQENGIYDYGKQMPVPPSEYPIQESGVYDYGGPMAIPSSEYTPQESGFDVYQRQFPLPPSEYTEPCASLFGYWPCLLKEYQRNDECGEQGYGNEWRKTEEYFFGSSYSCNEVSQVDVNYGYERHYVEEPSYVQEEYNHQSWSQKLNCSYYESYQES